MKYTQPIEDIMQYTDRNGVNYVAAKPADMDLEPWFYDMIERYGLPRLVVMFPYMTLVVDENTGMLKTYDQTCKFNARVTNAFHILWAQECDKNPQLAQTPINGMEFGLNLIDAYPDEDEEEIRDIPPPSHETMIITDKDGYSIDYTNMPESIPLSVPKNWHPNRDANGNYLSAQPYNPYMPYHGGFNYNQYSYLPNYRTFQYPF